jgi:predicted RNase H-like HicB family nuclease
MEITVVVHQERQSFWSEIKELPGCFASGGTLDELREALEEAIGLYLYEDPIELSHQPLRLGECRLRFDAPPEPSRASPSR